MPQPLSGKTRRVVLIGAVGCALLVGFAGCMCLHPANEVAVTVSNLPQSAQFVCLAADTGHDLRVMEWSMTKVFPFTMHPASCTHSDPTCASDDTFQRKVRWESAKRVGVVMWGHEKGWRVAWFESGKSRRTGNIPLLHGGSWEGDVAAVDTEESLSSEQVKQLGLSAVEKEWGKSGWDSP